MMGRQPGPKPIAGRDKVGFEDWLEHDLRRAITTLSAAQGIPSGRKWPGLPGFGMYTPQR
jgi:hypothetical protein